jgi:MoaA/NifB/PqqE/SkfB family radical SAM enzyme
VSIALTNACDLNCSYCYAPKHGASLDFESLIGWLGELDRTGCLAVGFGGGEPTLYRRLPEICRFVAMKTGLAVTFTTHAHHLNAGLLGQLSGYVHFVRVSMDGVGSTYELLRGRPFGDLRSRLSALRDVVPFGLNLVVNSQTLPDLDRAVDVAMEFGARELLLLPEQPVNGNGGIDPESAHSLRHWVKHYHRPVQLNVSEAGAEGMPYCSPTAAEKGLRAYAHIDASGNLKRSSYESQGVSIGASGLAQALEQLRNLHKEEVGG